MAAHEPPDLARSLSMLALIALEAVVAAVGVARPEVYDGLVPSHYIAESRGQDLTTLLLGLPTLLLGLRTLRRAPLAGTALAAGALLYVAYVSIIYAYGGVANVLYFGYVGALGLSAFATWRVLTQVDLGAVRPRWDELPRRSVALFLWLESALLVVVWSGLGVTAIAQGSASEANTILVTDLAFVIPGFVLAGVWLWRKDPRGLVAAGTAVVLNIVLNASIVAGQLMRLSRGIEPAWPLAVMFGALGLIASGLGLRLLPRLDPRAQAG